jgi:hypothetical protein
MNSLKPIETLYSIIQNRFGDREARSAVLSMVGIILYDLQEEGLPISEENLSEKLEKYVEDFVQASKSDVA